MRPEDKEKICSYAFKGCKDAKDGMIFYIGKQFSSGWPTKGACISGGEFCLTQLGFCLDNYEYGLESLSQSF